MAKLPPATTELVVLGTLSFVWVKVRKAFVVHLLLKPSSFQAGRGHKGFLRSHFMGVGIKSFCLSSPQGGKDGS